MKLFGKGQDMFCPSSAHNVVGGESTEANGMFNTARLFNVSPGGV